MHILRADELNAKDTYKLLSGTVVPRPIAFVTTRSSINGAVNAAPFSFYNVVSAEPPLLAISVSRADGRQKDTARNAIAHREFVVHVSDPDVRELGMTDLSVTDSACISVPGIKEAKVRFECILERHLPFQNDSGETTTDLIIGRVVCFHLNDQVYDADKGYIRTDELKPAARLAGNEYVRLGKTYTLVRPT